MYGLKFGSSGGAVPGRSTAAFERLRNAPAIIGPIEVNGHSEMPPCCRLLLAVAEIVPVTRHRREPVTFHRAAAALAPPVRALPRLPAR